MRLSGACTCVPCAKVVGCVVHAGGRGAKASQAEEADVPLAGVSECGHIQYVQSGSMLSRLHASGASHQSSQQ